MLLLIIVAIVAIAVISVIIAASSYRPPSVSPEGQNRLDQIAKLELNNTRAQQKYLEAINEGNVTKKIELLKEANMYQNGTLAETCRLYPELKC